MNNNYWYPGTTLHHKYWIPGTILRTKPDNPPTTGKNETSFFCKVLKNDGNGLVKVDWEIPQNKKEHGEILQFHFSWDNKPLWISTSHFLFHEFHQAPHTATAAPPIESARVHVHYHNYKIVEKKRSFSKFCTSKFYTTYKTVGTRCPRCHETCKALRHEDITTCPNCSLSMQLSGNALYIWDEEPSSPSSKEKKKEPTILNVEYFNHGWFVNDRWFPIKTVNTKEGAIIAHREGWVGISRKIIEGDSSIDGCLLEFVNKKTGEKRYATYQAPSSDDV